LRQPAARAGASRDPLEAQRHMPFNIGPGELILLLILALIIVGPGKLPDVGAAIGKSLREFRRAASDVNDAATVPPAGQSPAGPAPNVLEAPATPNAIASQAAGATPTPGGASQQDEPGSKPAGSPPAQNGTAPDSSPS
jgi:sec-independent protein translocase protein TatA